LAPARSRRSEAETDKSAVSRVSPPAAGATTARPADWEVGGTAGWETCATRRCRIAAENPRENKMNDFDS